jgi:putative membrane protein
VLKKGIKAMLWLKTFHIVFMVTWFAGLFYLPRLFVYHAMTDNRQTAATFVIMERKLLIMTHIGAVLTFIFGLLLLWQIPGFLQQGWFQLKLLLVLILLGYHHACMRLVKKFAQGVNNRSHRWYRWFNEFPVLILIAVVALVVLKPAF